MKLSLSLDELLVRDVDAFVQEHSGMDRSKVVDEALRLWSAAQQRTAMELQFADGDDGPTAEYLAWRDTRREAARRLAMRR